jgi:hypothetical protein
VLAVGVDPQRIASATQIPTKLALRAHRITIAMGEGKDNILDKERLIITKCSFQVLFLF